MEVVAPGGQGNTEGAGADSGKLQQDLLLAQEMIENLKQETQDYQDSPAGSGILERGSAAVCWN